MALATESKDVFMEYDVSFDVTYLAAYIAEYSEKPMSKVLLEKARELLQGITDCTLYETSQVEQIDADVRSIINELAATGDAYSMLSNALLQLSVVLNAADEDLSSNELVVEAKALYIDVLTNYTDGIYDRDAAASKTDEVTQMTARLKELTLGIGDILAADCQVEFFTTDGRRLEHAQKGIVVMKITHADGTVNIRKMKVE